MKTHYIIEIEDINTRSGDMFEYGRYETIDDASRHMQRAIDATQAEYDLKSKETCKPCVLVLISKLTLDDDGDLVSQESIDGAKLRHRAKTIWRVKARAYTTYKDGEIIEDTLPANASAEQLSLYIKDGFLTYDAIDECSQVVSSSDYDDAKEFELFNGGRIKHVWGYATGNQTGEHNEHNTFSHVVLLDDEGEELESYAVDFAFSGEDEPTGEDWQALEDAGTRAILAHFVA